ncbi:MAG: YkgJ family cysteine cluster protein [Clostridia bacterium]|nr:YkgJ family cysteine cluster protein [Clostridia bacterium]
MNQNIINLSGEWISSFIQNNKIYNERVNFIQKDEKISANIILNYDGEICNYEFSGVINKNIINGTYVYTENSDIESGTISLKIINEDFLYGVATYISDNDKSDDIVQSPYALFRNTDNKLGTFNLCSNCVGNNSTCCSDMSVDSPMLLPNEVEAISKKMKIGKDEFCNKINLSKINNDYSLKDLYQMKRDDKNNSCYFYKNNQCTIYDIRPIDCRIFPYDIKLEKDGNYYLVYYKSDKCQIMNENLKDIKMISYNTRLFLRLLLPYIREWSDKYCCKHLTEKQNYEIICKIEDLF